jgi:hypothetical protein
MPIAPATPDPLLQNDPRIREALAAWDEKRTDDAVRQWIAATGSRPQWTNPAWRAALYPARIEALASALERERQLRAAATQRGRTAARR